MYTRAFLSALAIVGSTFAEDVASPASIQGNANKIQMLIPGASLTLESNSPSDPNDNSDWQTSYIPNSFVQEAITTAVNNGINGYATTDDVADAFEPCATRDDLAASMVSREVFASSVVLRECDNTSPKKRCESGNRSIHADIYGYGFVIGEPDLYTCVLTVDGKNMSSNVTVTSVSNGRQKASCILPGAFHSQNVNFDGYLSLVEGGVLTVPSVPWNPLISYYNSGPTIESLGTRNLYVNGPNSILKNDQYVPLQLEYEDYYDDVTTLKVEFTSKSGQQIQNNQNNFDLDVNTQIVTLKFTRSWMNQFLALSDPLSKQLITINMKLTDSHGESTNRDLTFNVSHQPPSWNTDGSSSSLTPQARAALYQRMARPDGQQFSLCYDAFRDGWSTYTYHQNCDNKGPLLLLMKRKGSDRVNGGYQFKSATSNCGYVSGGILGDATSAPDRGWLFMIKDDDATTVNFAYQQRYPQYMNYQCSSSFMVWGGGHDFSCRSTSCYCNLGHSYRTSSSSNPNNDWCTGLYSFRTSSFSIRDSMEFYEVYSLDQ